MRTDTLVSCMAGALAFYVGRDVLLYMHQMEEIRQMRKEAKEKHDKLQK